MWKRIVLITWIIIASNNEDYRYDCCVVNVTVETRYFIICHCCIVVVVDDIRRRAIPDDYSLLLVTIVQLLGRLQWRSYNYDR